MLTLSTAAVAKPSEPSKKRPLIERAKDIAVPGKVEQAKILLDRILANEPKNAEAWYLLGYVYQNMSIMDGGMKRARDCYLKTISIAPDHSEAYQKLAELAGIDGNWQESIKYCNKALTCPNPDKRTYKSRAIAKSNLHRDKEALADFELYKLEMPLQANSPRGMDEYATFLENTGQYEKAIKTLEVLEKYDSRPSLPVRRARIRDPLCRSRFHFYQRWQIEGSAKRLGQSDRIATDIKILSITGSSIRQARQPTKSKGR
jgi:tetratricopeptide (TPR) repeat protein